MTKPTRPLDIYVRTSAKGGRSDETLQTLDQQVADCKSYAAREGLTLSGFVLEDKYRSGAAGKRAKRKALTHALERIRQGESGGIVVAYLSRATREGGTGLALFEEIDRAGGGIYGPNVPRDWQSADGRLTLGLLLIIDAHVVDKAREHTAKAKANSIARGVPTSAFPPAGYSRGSDRRYVPNSDAPHVRKAFEMRASGVGSTRIADYLNAHGVTTARGGAWSPSTVRRSLRNRVYLGEARCGEHVNPCAHEPIVTASVFHAASRVEREERRPRGDAHRTYLLAGLLRCADCGYVLQGSKDSHNAPLYRCSVHHAPGRCTNPARANAARIEAEVVEAYLAEDRVLRLPTHTQTDLTVLQEALQVAQRRLDQVMSEEARDALGELWASDVKARRLAHEEASAALGAAQVVEGHDTERLVRLKAHWRDESLLSITQGANIEHTAYFLSDDLKRELLLARYEAITVRRTGRGTWEWSEDEGVTQAPAILAEARAA